MSRFGRSVRQVNAAHAVSPRRTPSLLERRHKSNLTLLRSIDEAVKERTAVELHWRPHWTADQFIESFGYVEKANRLDYEKGKLVRPIRFDTARPDGNLFTCSYMGKFGVSDAENFDEVFVQSIRQCTDRSVRHQLEQQRQQYMTFIHYHK